jgi:hypothetical protein
MSKSTDDFDEISSTWKKAIQSLQNISEGTTPYEKIPKLLDLYGQEYKNIDIAIMRMYQRKNGVFLEEFEMFYPYLKEHFNKNKDSLRKKDLENV